jgi:hypothetical protein
MKPATPTRTGQNERRPFNAHRTFPHFQSAALSGAVSFRKIRRLQLIVLVGVVAFLGTFTEGQLAATERSAVYPLNPAIVRRVQIALRNRGYYHGLVDGYLGEETGIAIQRFQIDHCIRVIPLLDPSLLVSLGISRAY